MHNIKDLLKTLRIKLNNIIPELKINGFAIYLYRLGKSRHYLLQFQLFENELNLFPCRIHSLNPPFFKPMKMKLLIKKFKENVHVLDSFLRELIEQMFLISFLIVDVPFWRDNENFR